MNYYDYIVGWLLYKIGISANSQEEFSMYERLVWHYWIILYKIGISANSQEALSKALGA